MEYDTWLKLLMSKTNFAVGVLCWDLVEGSVYSSPQDLNGSLSLQILLLMSEASVKCPIDIEILYIKWVLYPVDLCRTHLLEDSQVCWEWQHMHKEILFEINRSRDFGFHESLSFNCSGDITCYMLISYNNIDKLGPFLKDSPLDKPQVTNLKLLNTIIK